MNHVRQYKISKQPLPNWLVVHQLDDGNYLLKIIHVSNAKTNPNEFRLKAQIKQDLKDNYPNQNIPRKKK